MKNLIIVLFSALAPALSLAEEANVLSANLNFSTLEKIFKKMDASFELATKSNFYTPSSSKYALSTGLEMTTTYKSERGITSGFIAGFSKDLVNERTQELNDTTLFTSTKIGHWSDIAKLSILGKVILPTNETSRKVNTLRTTLGASTALNIDLRRAHLKYVQVKNTLAGQLSFHRFTTTAENEANVQKRLANTISISYAPFEKTSFSYDFSMAQKWSYKGRLGSPLFSNSLSITHTLSDHAELSLGVSNKGSVYKSNGVDNNIAIFDGTTATAFGSVVIAI